MVLRLKFDVKMLRWYIYGKSFWCCEVDFAENLCDRNDIGPS
jgi:hypothetical protein